MKPETGKQFIFASRAIATEFIDRFVRMGMAPDEVANLCGAALGEILAQQLGPFSAVERLRDIADQLEGQILKQGSGN